MNRKPRTEDVGRLLSMTYVPGGAKGEEEQQQQWTALSWIGEQFTVLMYKLLRVVARPGSISSSFWRLVFSSRLSFSLRRGESRTTAHSALCPGWGLCGLSGLTAVASGCDFSNNQRIICAGSLVRALFRRLVQLF